VAVEVATLAFGLDPRPMITGANQARDALGRFVKEAEKASKEIVELEAESKGALEPITKEANKGRDALGRFTKGAGDANKAIRDTAAASKEAERSSGLLQRSLGRVGAELKLFAAGFIGIQGIRSVTTTLAAFETQIAQISAIGGIDRASDEFKQLVDTARQLGATTAFSAAEAAGGLLELTKAGFSARDSIATIGPALTLAIAGEVSLERSTSILLTAMSQFGLATSDATRIADVFVGQASATQASVDGMADSFRVVGPIVAQTGGSFEFAAAVIAELSKSTIEATLAGTGYRAVLASLSNPAGETLTALKQLRLGVEEVNPSVVGLDVALQRIADRSPNATQNFQLFGREAATVGALMVKAAAGIKQSSDESDRFDGIAKKVADALSNTLAGSLKSLNSAFQELVLQAGDAGALGALRGIVDFSTDVIRALGSGEASAEAQAVAFTAVAFAAGAATLAVKGLTGALLTNPLGASATAAVGAWLLLKDSIIEVGDGAATVEDIIVAAFDAIAARAGIVELELRILALEAGRVISRLKFDNDAVQAFDFLIVAAKGARAGVEKELGQIDDDIAKRAVARAKARDLALNPLLPPEGVGVKEAQRRLAAAVPAGLGATVADVETGSGSFGGGDSQTEAAFFELGKPEGSVFSLDLARDELETRRALVGLTSEQAKIENELRVAREAAAIQFGEGTVEGAAAIAEYETRLRSIVALETEAARVAKESADQKKATADLAAFDEELGFRKSVVGLSREQVELERELRKIRELAAAANPDDPTAASGVVAEKKLAIEGVIAQEEFAAKAERLGAAVAEPFGVGLNSGIRTILEGGDLDFGSIGRSIATDILSGLLDELIVSPLVESIKTFLQEVVTGEAINKAIVQATSAVSSVLLAADGAVISNGDVTAFAKGAAFGGGNVVPFASGGITTGPTFFPLRGGKVGLMGEAGQEAIVPLDRTSDGKLGINAQGIGGAGPTYITVTTRDADSFRRSRQHILADEKRLRKRYGLDRD
jgi:TP901 family phage tail tape measure protein